MASSMLDGAATYLNNLLFARGFLQNGEAIDFPRLASNEDGIDRNATTVRAINLIHDLILRRDRDAEQREALASTIHRLRTEQSQYVLDLQRLQDKNIQFQNELTASEARQRSLINSAKKSQNQTREIKEQMLKMKSTLDQVRAKSISDIRKRDVEIEKLREHLKGMNRGKKESGSENAKLRTGSVQQKHVKHEARSQQDHDTSEWCLEKEPNDFLTAVLNETTSENVALRKIVGDSMKYLKALTGLEEQQHQKPVSDIDNAIGIPGQYRDRNIENPTSLATSESLIPVQQLASSMSEVLSHCQNILRDPSFVPIEEVQVRDEEIAKLKTGWEKMADHWKEAVTMMSSWRQKMMSEQESEAHFNAEDLSTIAAFSRSFATRPNGLPVLDPIEEEELTSMLIEHYSRVENQSMMSDNNEASHSHTSQDDTLPEPEKTGTPGPSPVRIQVDGEEDKETSRDITFAQTIASPARRGIKLQKQDRQAPQPLSNTNANAKKRKSSEAKSSPHKRQSLSPINGAEEAQIENNATASNVSLIASSNSTDPLSLDISTPGASDDEDDFFLSQNQSSGSHDSTFPRMTVAEKLAAVEAEATEATEVIRRRQATTYDKGDKRAKDRARNSMAKTTGVAKGADRSKDKVRKAKDRRRSTLTPAELGSLMGR
ncbi:hypothetical protein LTR05_000427 [Lithohypha guttulata]|uniref:Afadin and alpha-actinin-binding-domain-containing protein n=1 Tax=Lithohypha guttulata TaxID=1690604 RepID=A0AAN7YKC2_9EURO|nr:hypothetical protein LTR05_000427 [Lithohypha guttulata]